MGGVERSQVEVGNDMVCGRWLLMCLDFLAKY